MFWHSIALGLTFFIVPWLQAQSPQDIQKATLAEVNPKTPEVSTEELRKILADSSAAVFDVRPRMEFAVSHIPGALNVAQKPGSSKALYVSDAAEIGRLLGGDKSKPMVLYCNGPFCGKSKRLAEELLSAGYGNVRRYQLGIPVWRALGGITQMEADGARYVKQGDATAVWLDTRAAEQFQKGSLPGAKRVGVEVTQGGKDNPAMQRVKNDGTLPVEDHNTRVIVILDRQGTVILDALHRGIVLAALGDLDADALCARQRAFLELLGRACVQPHRGSVALFDVPRAVRLHLRNTSERPPHGNTELIAANIAVSGREQFLRQALALPAKRPVAVENHRFALVATKKASDLGCIRNVEGLRAAGLLRNVESAGNVTDGEFHARPHVENRRRAVGEDLSQFFGGDFGCLGIDLSERSLLDVLRGLSLEQGNDEKCQTEGHGMPEHTGQPPFAAILTLSCLLKPVGPTRQLTIEPILLAG